MIVSIFCTVALLFSVSVEAVKTQQLAFHQLFDLSGDNAFFSVPLAWASQVAVDDINAQTAILPDHELILRTNDTHSNAQTGHFLLTYLLLPTLTRSAPSRVVNLSSSMHTLVKTLPLDKLNVAAAENYDGIMQYNTTKLLLMLQARHIAKFTAKTGVSAFSLHPGVIPTDVNKTHCLLNCLFCLPRTFGLTCCFCCRPCMKGVSEGAATTIYCALTPGLEASTGHYFSDCRDTQPSTLAQNDTLAAELWAVSERMCKITSEEQHDSDVFGRDREFLRDSGDQKKTE